ATRPDDASIVSHRARKTESRGRKRQGPANGACRKPGAGNETRTRDPDLGKVVLYQLSYSRVEPAILRPAHGLSILFASSARRAGQAARAYSKPDHRVRIAAAASSH